MEQGIKASRVIGTNVRRFRKVRKVTQERLAARLQANGCDMSRSTLAKVEAGLRHLSVTELEALRLCLNMEYKDFFERQKSETNG